jgi:hypothetical protein
VNPSYDDEETFDRSSERISSTAAKYKSDFAQINNGLPNFAISSTDDSSDSEEDSPRNEDVSIDTDDEESVATTVPDAVSIKRCNLFHVSIFVPHSPFTFSSVYYMLRKFNRLCDYSMRSSNLLLTVFKEH